MKLNGITKDGEIIPISHDLGLRGRVLMVGWELPDDLSEGEWLAAGSLLGKVERSVSWWLGDWWAFGEARYGERKAIVDADDWDGPAFDTCAAAASVCRAFETCRRRQVLSFAHHREVAGLPADEADALLDWCEETIPSKGKPRPRNELRGEVSRRRRPIGALPSSETCTLQDLAMLVSVGKKFGCVYADPPWLYDNQGTRAATGNHYDGMTVEELCAMPVGDLVADDAHLHLWTTNGFLFECPRIFTAWGFEFRSSFIWAKPQIGIGNYWRNAHEFLLTAVRGDSRRFNDHNLRSWIECDRGPHSEKPEQVRSMIERASPSPRLELFGRRPAEGWTVFGNQIERNLFFAA